jgi:uroporphyrinogen-III synthase
MSFRIFISRSENEVLKLAEFCKNRNWTIFAKSLISFQLVPFQIPSDFQVVFFPSPRAAQFFLDNSSTPNLSNTLVACAGEQTATTIRKMGLEVHFIPSQSGNILKVRAEFQEWLGERKVLYVGSNLARKSVLTNLNENQWSFLPVYKTKFESDRVPESDIYVFSSPSNVQSFLMSNLLPIHAEVIAWGSTTAEELAKNSINTKHILNNSNEDELISFLAKY